MPTISDNLQPTAHDLPKGFTLPFEIRPSHITLVERNQFAGLPDEDPWKHMEIFTDYCCSISVPAGVTQDEVKAMMFKFSLKDDAREWYRYLDRATAKVTDWTSLALAFYNQYYSSAKTNALRAQISNFQQGPDEKFHEAWVHFKKLVRSVPHHGFELWYLCDQFYNSLYDDYRVILDSAANGRFQNNVAGNKGWNIIEEMAVHRAEYGNSHGNSPKPSVETSTVAAFETSINARFEKLENSSIHETNETVEFEALVQLISAQIMKMEEARIEQDKNLANKLAVLVANQAASSSSNFKRPIETVNAINLHSGVSYNGPEMPKEDSGHIEEHSIISNAEKEIVSSKVGRATNSIGRSTEASDIANNSDNQKLIERSTDGRSTIPTGRPTEAVIRPTEHTSRSTGDPVQNGNPSLDLHNTSANEDVMEVLNTRKPKIVDPTTSVAVPYPERLENAKLELQFGKFLEIVKGLEFMKDILSRKRYIEDLHVVAFTATGTAHLRNKLPHKRFDPGSFSISCCIGTHIVDNALCDTGASVSVMPVSLARRLGFTKFRITDITVQMANRTQSRPIGILEDISVQIEKFFISVDFLVLDIPEDRHTPIILGRPFLCTVGAVIDFRGKTMTIQVGDENLTLFQTGVHRALMQIKPCDAISSIDPVTDPPITSTELFSAVLTPLPQLGSRLKDYAVVSFAAGLGREGIEDPGDISETEFEQAAERDRPGKVKKRGFAYATPDCLPSAKPVIWKPRVAVHPAEGTSFNQVPYFGVSSC
ncbi:uncharacterized protein LOC141628998 [Silene latifolia]|uniref:uncharacterized protein LOC141628998 n=1 Tax=Silene latifolia TaxID=37657 RepID=UPI003D76B9A9